MRTILALSLATALLVAACSSSTPDARVRPADQRSVEPAGELVAFDDCDQLTAYAAEQAADWWTSTERVAVTSGQLREADAASDLATSAPTPYTSEARIDHSTTNNQEVGVDEADLVKTDGELVLTTADGRLRVLDATGREPELVGSLDLPESGSHEMLVQGDRVLVLTAGDLTIPVDPQQQEPGWPTDRFIPTTVLTEVDVSDPAHPTEVARRQVDGNYRTARAIDGTARIILGSEPHYGGPVPVLRDDGTFDADLVATLPATDWLPATTVVADDGQITREPVVDCGDVSRPVDSTVGGIGTVTVLTVDLTRPLDDLQATSVMGRAEHVYASADNLYLAGTSWGEDGSVTDIHQLSLEGSEPARYEASGSVSGRPLNQFAFSEHEGRLRVATTDDLAPDSGESESAITVLEASGDELREVGHVAGMGEGEQIYSVRFLGDTAYVVTFRQTDPLYTVDLSDPTAPRVVGELKIPGYSAYLHPVGDDLLLGVGQDADANGRTLGLQVSLFDVSDPSDPVRLQQFHLPAAQTEAEYDHRAFLWWAAEGLAVVPMNGYDRGNAYNAATGLDVGPDAIAEVGRIVHEREAGVTPVGSPPPACPPGADCVFPTSIESATGTIVRSLVVNDDQLWTVSELGIEISDVDTLTLEGWISFG